MGKYGNVKTIKPTYTNLSLHVGMTQQLGCKTTTYNKKKHLPKKYGTALSYFSSDPAVAKVSNTGIVTGVAKGTATIYIQDLCGKYCKTVVIVN